jgi:release factor glutamine methyltransferase
VVAVEGRLDQIVFDPPFRWFPARDRLEANMADQNERVLTRFMSEASGYLAERGRIPPVLRLLR